MVILWMKMKRADPSLRQEVSHEAEVRMEI
jgi:hypothetical protein